jgi:AcrR family transcriptional regulator
LSDERVHNPETLARIVASARRCFLECGVSRTRMSDVAEGAGMVRQTIYDFVANKGELVDLALAARIEELGGIVRARPLRRRADIRERLVELFAVIVETCRDDPEFNVLTGALGERHAFQYMAGPSALTETMTTVVAEIFEEADHSGVLRRDVPQRQIVEWLQAMLATLVVREDLDRDRLRDTLRAFALPAVLR